MTWYTLQTYGRTDPNYRKVVLLKNNKRINFKNLLTYFEMRTKHICHINSYKNYNKIHFYIKKKNTIRL